MAKFKSSIGFMAISIFELVVGVLLLINPVGFTSGIIIASGVALLALGAWSILRYFRLAPAEAAKAQSLARGLGMALLGLFCVLHSGWFISTFPVLTLLYGVAMLLMSLVRIQWTVDALRMKREWLWPCISAVLSLVLSALIILNPFGSASVLWIFAALSLIAESVVDLLSLILPAKTRKQAQ